MTLLITTAEATEIIRNFYHLPPEVKVEFQDRVLTLNRAVHVIGDVFFDSMGYMMRDKKIMLIKRIRELTHAGLADAKFAAEAWDNEVTKPFNHGGDIEISRVSNKTLIALLTTLKEQFGVGRND